MQYYIELLSGNPVYGPKAEYGSKRIYDISTFLVRYAASASPKDRLTL